MGREVKAAGADDLPRNEVTYKEIGVAMGVHYEALGYQVERLRMTKAIDSRPRKG